MRTKHLATLICGFAFFSATTISVTGQQEPLPPVKPKVSTDSIANAPQPSVVLDSTSIPPLQPPSLAESARNNDYVSFATAYLTMKKNGEKVDEFTPLYELWTWSLADPIGAFYGRGTYDQLVRAYPGFAQFIAERAIVDDQGNTFWPTSETRDFLLARAVAGEATTVHVAEVPQMRAIPKEPVTVELPRTETRATTATTHTRIARASTTPSATATKTRARKSTTRKATSHHRVAKDGAVAKTTRKPVETKAVETKPVETKTAAVPPAPVSEPLASTQAPAPAPAATSQPIESAQQQPPAPAPTTQTPAPTPVTQAQPVPAPATAAVPATRESSWKGIAMLALLTMLGVALFAIMMRAPKDELATLDKAKRNAPVEPIRLTPRQGETRGPESPGSNEPQQHSPSSPDRSLRDGDARGHRR